MAKKWWEIPGICLLVLILAVISTYPLILHFDSGIPYAPFGGEALNRTGDSLQLLYWFWLVKENFIGAVPFDTNPFEFNMSIAHETTGLTTVPLAFLYMLFSPFGEIAAYNCTVLSSYVLAGTFMYLLVRLYSGSRVGALLGAIIFTFAPGRINGVTGGNAYGFLFFCYPWVLFFLEKGIRSKKLRYGFLAGVGLIVLSMLEAHLLYYICVFLGMYIPVRIVALFPVCQTPHSHSRDVNKGFFSWSVSRSLIILWGAGAAATFYTQTLFFYRDQDPFFTPFFWWVLAIYPFIPVLVALCFASLYQRLSPLDFRRSLAVEAGSFAAFYLLIPLSLLSYFNRPLDTTIVVASVAVTVIATKLFLLREYLFSMLKVLVNGLLAWKNKLWPILPVIFVMGYIVVWIPLVKVNKFASTIAVSGRTLKDVKLYSSHLSDLFLPISNIYIGIVPAVLVGFFILAWSRSFFLNRQHQKFNQESGLIALFYLVVVFCSYILALGLAFGKSSLYILFYNYLPFFNYPRVSDRIIVLVLFALAVLVGYVVQYIQQRCTRRFSLGVVIFLVLSATVFQLHDYNLIKPIGVTYLDKGQDIYTHVKENVGDGLLLEIPLWPGDSHQSSLYQHYIMYDRVPRVNGYTPLVRTDYIDKVFKPLATINQGRLDRQQYELLQQLGVKFITVHDNRDVFTHKVSPFAPLTTVRRFKNSQYLEFVEMKNMRHFNGFNERNDDLYLFRLKNKETVESDLERSAWYDMPVIYDVNSRLSQKTGEVVEDKRTGRKVFQAIEGKNKLGFMVYGPYAVYSPGKYRCYFTVDTDANTDEKIARIEVSSATGSKEQLVLAQTELRRDKENKLYRKVYLDFSIAESTKLEFRVFYYGKGNLRVEQISVYQAGKDTPLNFLEAAMMVGDTGQLVLEKDAVGGKVIEAIVGKSKNGDIVYGPNRIYSKGKYRARYYLRTKDAQRINKTDVAAVLSVTDGQNSTIFSRRNVSAMQLSEDSFTGIDVEFEITRDEEISFHMEFTGKASLQLDRIEVTEREGSGIASGIIQAIYTIFNSEDPKK